MSKFLIIGSNSFSGSHFVHQTLNCGFEVFGVSRSKEPIDIFLPYKWESNGFSQNIYESNQFKFKSIDLNKDLKEFKQIIDNFKPEIIVNFASQGMVAESWLNPTHWYQTNLMAQVALHDFLRKKTFLKKYVHVTTPEVYGSTDGGWIKENFSFAPSTPYAVSRAGCDLHLMSFYKAYDFPVVFTRAANVYGPGQQLYRIIPRAFLSAKTNKRMALHGGGKSCRAFIHIKDVVDATLKIALDAEPGTSWHISSNESISIYDLVKKIFALTNSDFDSLVVNVDERLGKDQNYLLNSDKLRKVHSWSDKINLELGLESTLKWIEKHLSILRDLPWDYQHKS